MTERYCISAPCAWQEPKIKLTQYDDYYKCPMCELVYLTENFYINEGEKNLKILEEVMQPEKIDVLNGGFVRLVDYMGSDLAIVRNARVSYNADWRKSPGVNRDTTCSDFMKPIPSPDEKLISYLWKNKHTSPFEAVNFTFEVKAPIFVFRQWHRHRTWSYNEISARYTELDEGYYIPELDKITTQSTSNKQMRTNEQHADAVVIADNIKDHCEISFRTYKELIRIGCPRELARSVLPVAAYSRMFATVDLKNLFHFLELRLHEHSQYEIRVYAEAMLQLIEPIVPIAVAAFKTI